MIEALISSRYHDYTKRTNNILLQFQLLFLFSKIYILKTSEMKKKFMSTKEKCRNLRKKGRQMERWIDRQMDGQIDRWVDGQMDRWIDGQMDKLIGGQMDRWKDGQIDRWIDGQKDIY